MQSSAAMRRLHTAKVELALLLAASISCVAVLTVGVAASKDQVQNAPATGQLFAAALVAGGVSLAFLLLGTLLYASRKKLRTIQSENSALRINLATAESLVKAEPQTLVYWEHGRGLRIVTQTLNDVPGLPSNQGELLRFGLWLDASSARSLKSSLDTLFAEGRAFNLILKTIAGGHLEADGRAAGGRAILRLRDIAGYKRDVSAIIDKHNTLAREVRAGRALLDALPNPVWLRDGEGRLTWVNAAYSKAVEAKDAADAVAGQIELLDSRHRKSVDKDLKASKAYKGRLPLISGGVLKSHDVIVLNVGDAVAGAAIDVADLETVQGELERQIEAYDRTLDRVVTAVAVFNRDQKLTFFNEAYVRLWKHDPAWLKTQPSDRAILDRLRELERLPVVGHFRDWQQKVLSTYQTGTGQEDWWQLPDGRMLHVVAEQRPDGGVTYLYNDETEKIDLESRVKSLSGVQSETLNSLKEGVAVFATDGRLQLYNPAFAMIWKLSPRRLNEAPHIDEFSRDASVLYDNPDVWSQLRQAVTSFSDEREPLEGQMVRPDESVIDFAVTPLPDGGTLLTFADVTDAHLAEKALVERNEALEATARIKNRFIGTMSYELRTPLTNIIGFSEFLTSGVPGPFNEKQREYLDDISGSSKTLLAIIDGILDLANIDAGAVELNLEPLKSQELIDEAISGVKDAAARAELTLDIAIADDAEDLTADGSRVEQVLRNLLSNAVGFSKPGGVVQVTCWREAEFVVFSVEDRGPGIPKEQLARIFERFESRSHGSKHRGAGLGLSIVKSLVDLHGGDIKIDSEVGRGTLVTVRIPDRALARSNALDDTADRQVSALRNAAAKETPFEDEEPSAADDTPLDRTAG